MSSAPSVGGDGPLGHDVLAADELAGLLEDGGGAFRHESIESAADGGIGGDAAGAVRATADGADHEVGHLHGHALHGSDTLPGLCHPGPAGIDGGAGAALLLDDERLHGAATGLDGPRDPLAVEALAAERDEQDGADVGMRGQSLDHHGAVVVGVAAAEADDVDVLLHAGGDTRGHVVGALDQVGHDHDVADAHPAIGAAEALDLCHCSPRACVRR